MVSRYDPPPKKSEKQNKSCFDRILKQIPIIFKRTPRLRIPRIYSCVRSMSEKTYKKTFLFFSLELKLELELRLKLELLEGGSKTLGMLVYFVPYLLYKGRSPPYNYNAKYTSLPESFGHSFKSFQFQLQKCNT